MKRRTTEHYRHLMQLFVNAVLSARRKSCASPSPPYHSVSNSLKTCSGSRCWCSTVPRPTEQGSKLLALLRQVELLEDEWLGDEQTGSTPLLLSLAVNADSLATWLLPALAPVLADPPSA